MSRYRGLSLVSTGGSLNKLKSLYREIHHVFVMDGPWDGLEYGNPSIIFRNYIIVLRDLLLLWFEFVCMFLYLHMVTFALRGG